MSSLLLKIIACLAMLSDHLGFHSVFGSEAASIMRLFGRIAFPIYCYLIAFGYRKTHNKYKYLLRLIILAIISEWPFQYCFGGRFEPPSFNNVFFTLALGLASVICFDLIRNISLKLTALAFIPPILASLLAEFVLESDYGYAGVLLIFFFHLAGDNKLSVSLICAAFAARKVIEAFAAAVFMVFTPPHTLNLPRFENNVWGLMQLFAAMALIPILLCNGSRGYVPKSRAGRKVLQYSFYLFYPVHLLLIGILIHA